MTYTISEVFEQGQFWCITGPGCGAAEVLDERSGVDLLLDVDRWGVGPEAVKANETGG